MSVTSFESVDVGVCASAASVTDVFDIEIVRTLPEMHALREGWELLEEVRDSATLFQSFAWCSLAAEVAADNGGCELFICCARKNGKLVAILPLQSMQKLFRTVLTGLAEPFQEFTDMLIAPRVSPKAVFSEVMVCLVGAGVDVLHFGQVRSDSKLFEAIEGKVPAIGESDAAPYVPITEWEDYPEFHKTVKSKTRKNMRNARNVMERTAPVTCQVSHEGPDLDAIMDRTHETRAQWLEEKGLTSGAFSDTQFGSFIGRFKSGNGCGVRSIGNSLYHGDELIAEQWGFIYRDRYYAFISSYNAEYAKLSPGKLHLGEVIKMGFDEGLKTIEFMIPDVPYKRTWASNMVVVRDHVIGFTFKGRLYANIWVNTLRPLLKTIAMKLPEGLRRVLFALASKFR